MRLIFAIFFITILFAGLARAGQTPDIASTSPESPSLYGGVGISWTVEHGGLIVVRVLEGGPAARAGVKPGDMLLAIDGSSIVMLAMDQVTEKIRGKVGTTLTLDFRREGATEPIEVHIERESLSEKWQLLAEQKENQAKFEKLQPLVAQGEADAQVSLGDMYCTGQAVKQDYTEAMKLYRQAADQGNAKASIAIARLHRMGLGVNADKAEGLRWMNRAAEQGDAGAQLALGHIYNSDDELLDYRVAVRWYRLAADHGDEEAQFFLAQMYARGDGVAKDATESSFWLRKAAVQGNKQAKVMIGYRYSIGEGVPLDGVEAAKWIRPSAESGWTSAQSTLGKLYAEGLGVKQDYEEAYYWLSLPSKCRDNDKETLKALEQVKGHLTAQQMNNVDRRIENFRWPRQFGNAGMGVTLPSGAKLMYWSCGCACAYTDPPQVYGPAAPILSNKR